MQTVDSADLTKLIWARGNKCTTLHVLPEKIFSPAICGFVPTPNRGASAKWDIFKESAIAEIALSQSSGYRRYWLCEKCIRLSSGSGTTASKADQVSKSIKRLGTAQTECLRLLNQFKHSWTYGGFNGWVWNTNSGTKKILDTLVKAGLVECKGKTYSLSDKGIMHLANLNEPE